MDWKRGGNRGEKIEKKKKIEMKKKKKIIGEGREIARKRESRKENQINPKKKKINLYFFFLSLFQSEQIKDKKKISSLE